MGNTHNNQPIQLQQTNLVSLLCSRNSINITADEEPVSPRVSCMGQLKMTHNNNKRSNRVSTNHLHLHNNINTTRNNKKLFSGKNLFLSSATASTSIKTTAAIRSNSWVGPRSSTTNNTTSFKQQHQFNFIREMDPPLPVVVMTNKPEDEGGHAEGRSSVLWKRRFGDVSSLETLDLNRLNTIHSTPPPPQPLSV